MTREETVRNLLTELIDMIDNGSERDLDRADEIGASIIKLLEQDSTLDKIRAEIEQNAYPIVHGVNNHELGMTLYGILQVIDEYKAESEK